MKAIQWISGLVGATVVISLMVTAYSAPKRASSRVERGEYLVTVGGCNDCHTPLKMGPKGPEPDMERMLSGHPETFRISELPKVAGPQWLMAAAATGTAFAGPWGVSFTANLTPDRNAGLGIWTEDMFIKTLRTGRHWGVSREILPPMPWFNYREMSDEDLKAVFAYLESIKPISNHVPEPLMPPSDQQVSAELGGEPVVN